MDANLIVEDTEPFLRITLNRPRRGNVVTPRMMLGLPAAIAGAGRRHKAVVLRGAGPDFCLGREPKPTPGGQTDTAFDAHAAVMAPILAVYPDGQARDEAQVPLHAQALAGQPLHRLQAAGRVDGIGAPLRHANGGGQRLVLGDVLHHRLRAGHEGVGGAGADLVDVQIGNRDEVDAQRFQHFGLVAGLRRHLRHLHARRLVGPNVGDREIPPCRAAAIGIDVPERSRHAG